MNYKILESSPTKLTVSLPNFKYFFLLIILWLFRGGGQQNYFALNPILENF